MQWKLVYDVVRYAAEKLTALARKCGCIFKETHTGDSEAYGIATVLSAWAL